MFSRFEPTPPKRACQGARSLRTNVSNCVTIQNANKDNAIHKDSILLFRAHKPARLRRLMQESGLDGRMKIAKMRRKHVERLIIQQYALLDACIEKSNCRYEQIKKGFDEVLTGYLAQYQPTKKTALNTIMLDGVMFMYYKTLSQRESALERYKSVTEHEIKELEGSLQSLHAELASANETIKDLEDEKRLLFNKLSITVELINKVNQYLNDVETPASTDSEKVNHLTP